MSLKRLASGGMAVAALGAAALGVSAVAGTSVAAASPVSVAPAEPAPCSADVARLRSVVDALLAPGVGFRAGKSDLVEGGIGRLDGAAADSALNRAYASGALPVAYSVSAPVCNGPTASSVLSARDRSINATFVPGGRFGWQLSRGSALQALQVFG